MTKTELETMLITLLYTSTAEAANLTLPSRREAETAKDLDKQKERVLKSLTRLPKEPIEDMPNAEERLEMHPMVQLPVLSEGVFLVLTERHVGEDAAKAYAVERLAEHLNWKTYRITSGTIGSKFVHETPEKTKRIFEKAKKNAPSLIIIDEMDAFMPNREEIGIGNKHHVEEVDCFLKCLQTAAENKVLVVGMTNLLSSIDPAILRTGRMGTHISVGMPERESVEAVRRGAVEKRPHEENLPFAALAEQLLNRPLSDVTYVAEEAAMQAVRADHPRITQADLEAALLRLQEHTAPKEERHAVGFCA